MTKPRLIPAGYKKCSKQLPHQMVHKYTPAQEKVNTRGSKPSPQARFSLARFSRDFRALYTHACAIPNVLEHAQEKNVQYKPVQTRTVQEQQRTSRDEFPGYSSCVRTGELYSKCVYKTCFIEQYITVVGLAAM